MKLILGIVEFLIEDKGSFFVIGAVNGLSNRWIRLRKLHKDCKYGIFSVHRSER